MAFGYQQSAAAELRQGELLGSVTEHTVRPGDSVEEPFLVDSRIHPRVIVVTADCDLLKDHQNRPPAADNPLHCLDHVLLCDVYTLEEIHGVTPATFGSKEMKVVRRNQNERYHVLPAATIEGTEISLPELYIDFRRCIGIPPTSLYRAIANGESLRLGRLPPVFLQDFCHRIFSFLSRVGADYD